MCHVIHGKDAVLSDLGHYFAREGKIWGGHLSILERVPPQVLCPSRGTLITTATGHICDRLFKREGIQEKAEQHMSSRLGRRR